MDFSSLIPFFAACWQVLSYPLNIPWIGPTSILKMSITLYILAVVVDFVSPFIGDGLDGSGTHTKPSRGMKFRRKK